MKTISLKGIGAGIVVAVVLSIPLGLMLGYYLSAVFNDLAPGVNFANEAEVQRFVARFLYHPLTIAFGILSTLIGVGIPAYLAAAIAGRAFIIHSMIIGGILSMLCLFEWEMVAQFPILFVLIISLNLVIAYFAGYLRLKQTLASTG